MFRGFIFMKLLLSFALLFSFPALAQDAASEQAQSTAQHAIALHGTPKYPADFTHLDYTNPDAPKGGTLKMGTIGSFDSLNPFIVKGTPAAGMNFLRSGFVYQSLMQNSWDEPFTLYGILAESIEVSPERDWVAFNLRPEAKWSDGKPVTADDVVWTFNTLVEDGQPFFKAYYGDVKSVTAQSPQRVMFEFSVKGNAELPLIVAEMAILPKHFWADKEFNKTSLDVPLGSGPYVVSKVDAGRSVEYARDPNWWGKDLPFFQGFYNFDRIEFDYYRDENVALEAFLANEYDVKIENTAKLWESAYNIPALKDGTLIKEEIENARPAGMQGFAFNTRRDIFKHEAVREALNYAFDFEWSNKQFAYGAYVRTDSYFENSELASAGLPEGDELALLERLKAAHPSAVPDEVFTQTYTNPKTNGSGNARGNLRKAMDILDKAGWALGEDGIRSKDGVRLEFEILDSSPMFERWVLPFVKNLERIGVKANLRVVDTAQYQNRLNAFDYDMTILAFGQSDSPGNEQRDYWNSEKAGIEGSKNYLGIQNPAIDQIVEELIVTKSREDLITHIHALDRILLAGHYVIPMWHYNKWRIAYWNHIKHPDTLSGISPLISDTWWNVQ